MAQLTTEGCLGIVRFGSELTYPRALGIVDDMVAREGYLARLTHLWDLRGTRVSLDVLQKRAVAANFDERVPPIRSPIKVAIIIEPARRSLALTVRSLLARFERCEYRTFEGEDTAREWLRPRPLGTQAPRPAAPATRLTLPAGLAPA